MKYLQIGVCGVGVAMLLASISMQGIDFMSSQKGKESPEVADTPKSAPELKDLRQHDEEDQFSDAGMKNKDTFETHDDPLAEHALFGGLAQSQSSSEAKRKRPKTKKNPYATNPFAMSSVISPELPEQEPLPRAERTHTPREEHSEQELGALLEMEVEDALEDDRTLLDHRANGAKTSGKCYDQTGCHCKKNCVDSSDNKPAFGMDSVGMPPGYCQQWMNWCRETCTRCVDRAEEEMTSWYCTQKGTLGCPTPLA